MILDCELNKRVASTRLNCNNRQLIYGIAAGKEKVSAIDGAIKSRLINALITDEYTAEQLLNK